MGNVSVKLPPVCLACLGDPGQATLRAQPHRSAAAGDPSAVASSFPPVLCSSLLTELSDGCSGSQSHLGDTVLTFELIVSFPNLSFLDPPFYVIHEFIQQIFTEFYHLTGRGSEGDKVLPLQGLQSRLPPSPTCPSQSECHL